LLLENTTEKHGHWLRVHLSQEAKNRFAIGATVSVKTGDVIRSKQVGVDGSYLSQHQIDVQFGIGDSELVDELIVTWPDGSTTVQTNVAADQTVLIVR